MKKSIQLKIDAQILQKQEDIITKFLENSTPEKEDVVKNLRLDQNKSQFLQKPLLFIYDKEKNNEYNKLGASLIEGYDALSSAIKLEYRRNFFTKNTRCPICGRILERSSKTGVGNADLDHFLPKSIYPQFALYPENLIPICKDCNQIEKGKKDLTLYAVCNILKQMNIKSPRHINVWENISFNFSNNTISLFNNNCHIKELMRIYGIENKYGFIKKQVYNNFFNIIKHHKINSPEGLESFLECCLSSNMQEMISDFSINNYPKIWNDFLDYVLYDYNNLSALWDELKEYNKLEYFS